MKESEKLDNDPQLEGKDISDSPFPERHDDVDVGARLAVAVAAAGASGSVGCWVLLPKMDRFNMDDMDAFLIGFVC